MLAVSNKHSDVVKFLLFEAEANPNLTRYAVCYMFVLLLFNLWIMTVHLIHDHACTRYSRMALLL